MARRVIHMRNLAVLIVAAVASAPLLVRTCYGQDQQTQALSIRLDGLQVTQARHTFVEGKDGIDIDLDKPSAERLRKFTNEFVGRRLVVFVNHRRLATLRLLDPVTGNGLRVTGDDLDGVVAQPVFSPGAIIDLAVVE